MTVSIRSLAASGALLALCALVFTIGAQAGVSPSGPGSAPAMVRRDPPDPPMPKDPKPRRQEQVAVKIARKWVI